MRPRLRNWTTADRLLLSYLFVTWQVPAIYENHAHWWLNASCYTASGLLLLIGWGALLRWIPLLSAYRSPLRETGSIALLTAWLLMGSAIWWYPSFGEAPYYSVDTTVQWLAITAPLIVAVAGSVSAWLWAWQQNTQRSHLYGGYQNRERLSIERPDVPLNYITILLLLTASIPGWLFSVSFLLWESLSLIMR